MPRILNNIPASNIIAIYTYEGGIIPRFGIVRKVNGEEVQETIRGEDTAKFLNNAIFNGQRVISKELEEAIVDSLDGAVQRVGDKYDYIPRVSQDSGSNKVTTTGQQLSHVHRFERPTSRQSPVTEDEALLTHLKKFRAYPKYDEITLTLADLCEYIFPRLANLFNQLNLREKIKALPPEEKFIIVSLACGYAPEVYVLYKYLGNELFNRINFFGIDSYYPPDISLDSDDPEVEKYNVITIAKKCFAFPNVHFELADASQSKEVAKLLPHNKLANFVIMRHPQIVNSPLISYPFIKMIRETIPEISTEDALCLVTTYVEAEYKKVCEIFNFCGENFEEVPLDFRAVRKNRPLFVACDGERFYPDTYAYVSRNKKQHQLMASKSFVLSESTKQQNLSGEVKSQLETKYVPLSAEQISPVVQMLVMPLILQFILNIHLARQETCFPAAEKRTFVDIFPDNLLTQEMAKDLDAQSLIDLSKINKRANSLFKPASLAHQYLKKFVERSAKKQIEALLTRMPLSFNLDHLCTAARSALRYGDFDLFKLIFEKREEILQQIELPTELVDKNNTYNFSAIVTAIESGQGVEEAFEKMRADLDEIVIKKGFPFQAMLDVGEIYDKKNASWTREQRILLSKKAFGYLQRLSPAWLRREFAIGICRLEKDGKLCSDTFILKSGESIDPARDVPDSGLGFDYVVNSHGGIPPGGCLDRAFLEDLFNTKQKILALVAILKSGLEYERAKKIS